MKTDTPRAELVSVTPEAAAKWLQKNDANRNMRDRKVVTYSSAMHSDEWMITGDGPKFDMNGRLINGQHTLQAVVNTGKTVPMFVFYNMHPDSQLVMDTGARRNTPDALKFAGVTGCNLNVLAATARIGILWNEGHFRRSGQGSPGREVTSLETLEWVEQNRDAVSTVCTADLLRGDLQIPASVLGFAILKLSRIDPDECSRFFSLIAGFKAQGKGDPIYTMLRRYRAAKDSKETLRHAQHLFFIFRTWNAWRAGESLYVLKVGNVSAGGGATSAIGMPEPK